MSFILRRYYRFYKNKNKIYETHSFQVLKYHYVHDPARTIPHFRCAPNRGDVVDHLEVAMQPVKSDKSYIHAT